MPDVNIFLNIVVARNIPEYQRLVVFRLGGIPKKPKGPGLVYLIPSLDRVVTVDLREQNREISNDTATTKDNIPISIDWRCYYKVLDPVKAIVAVPNFEEMTMGVASTRLRKIIQEIDNKDMPSERERIRNEINTGIYELTKRWGVIITKFEILKLVVGDQKANV